VHRFLLHNGEIRETSELLLSPGQVGFLNGWGIFSTLRVTDGVLFAFERHYERLQRDAARVRVPFDLSPADLKNTLLKLVDANRAFDATLRVAIVRNRGGLFEAPRLAHDADLVAFTADLTEWSEGVKLSYVPHGRYAAWPFAGTKLTSWAHNLTWYEQAHEQDFDEVILLNEHGQISECTSANIFMVEGERIVTPPVASSGCLPGVTRAILLEEIRLLGFTITERELTPSDLEQSNQVFITSTTRDLIPVLEIDREPLRQDRQAFEDLKRAFLQYRSQYAAKHARRREVLAL
jgi:branched-chain amino acid aminotransferase